MNRVPVESSQVKSVGYDPASKTLEVEFHGWGDKKPTVYQYAGVEPEVHEKFVGADSVGRFLNQNIKGQFDYVRLPDEEQPAEQGDGETDGQAA